MDVFDRAYSNLGKLWTAMWDNKKPTQKRKGKRAVSQKRLERYTDAFLTDDRSYEDNARVANQNQKRDAKRFVEAQQEKAPPLVKRAPVKKRTARKDAMRDDRTPEEKESQIPKSSELTERIEKAQERVDKVLKEPPKKNVRLLFQPILMETPQRRMLFMNPGDEKIRMAVYWSSRSGRNPTPTSLACRQKPSTSTCSGSRCPSHTAIRSEP